MLPETFQFSPAQNRKVTASFQGGHITSDAGLLLLREVDRRSGLSAALNRCLPDVRQPGKIRHTTQLMLRQRLYGIAAGYEDLNDHDSLRDDYTLQTTVGTDARLASRSTLSRLEQSLDRQAIVDAHQVLWDQFIASYKQAPQQIILDFDATDTTVHGEQAGRHFSFHYDSYCFLPLYVFAGRHLLVSYLRRSNQDAATHAWAITALLVRYLRKAWPKTRIIIRADSGFCRPQLLSWCDRNRIDYVIGLAKNSRLKAMVAEDIKAIKRNEAWSGKKRVVHKPIWYGARSWGAERRIIARLEMAGEKENPRFVVTSLTGFTAEAVYRKYYCMRGDMENRIKDQQLDLFADRTSSPRWWDQPVAHAAIRLRLHAIRAAQSAPAR